MLNNLISDLYPSIFHYLNVKELNIFRGLSKYLKQFCYFFNLIDWSDEIDWSEIKIILSNEDYTPENIRKHNIHNWYKILKNQRQESSQLNCPKLTWRHRSVRFTRKIIQRFYYRKKILQKIVSHSYNVLGSVTQDSLVELSCYRTTNLLTWSICDVHHQLLAKIKICSLFKRKEQTFEILRPNNKLWFKIKYLFTIRQPRSFEIYDFESLPWENSENMEQDLFLTNRKCYELAYSDQSRTYYCLKFNHIKPNKPSIKNCSILYRNKHLYEFGKKDHYFLYGYRQPFHGLYAFILSCCQILA